MKNIFILAIFLLPFLASAQLGKFHPEKYQSIKTINYIDSIHADTSYVFANGLIDFFNDHIIIDGVSYKVTLVNTDYLSSVDFYLQTLSITNKDGTIGELDILYQDNFEPIEIIYKKDLNHSIAYYTWI